MAFKQFTNCFVYPGSGKPYNEKDRTAFIIGNLLVALVIGGILGGVGFIFGGPAGAIIAGSIGWLAGLTALIEKAADQWLNHRLVCLGSEPLCAVGVVSHTPKTSDLLDFDNDQYFDLVLMPHPTVAAGADGALLAANRYQADGSVVPAFAKQVSDHPANDLLTDKFQAQTLLAPRADLEKDLGYVGFTDNESSPHRTGLHCEAEGDFWVRMKQFAPVLAALVTAAIGVTAAAAAAGSTAGSAIGCVILSWFFGPVGCAIGGFFGSLIGGALGGAAGGAAAYYLGIKPALQGLFDAAPGNVEDANVGDRALGPISMGDRVAVLGTHVYDGYHEGWHEFHPLRAVVKMNHSDPAMPPTPQEAFYLQWAPDFAGVPPPMPPGETVPLTVDDMKQGLSSANFRLRCEALRRTWCAMLSDAFSEPTRATQQSLDQRWTIHPVVDGCLPGTADAPPLH